VRGAPEQLRRFARIEIVRKRERQRGAYRFWILELTQSLDNLSALATIRRLARCGQCAVEEGTVARSRCNAKYRVDGVDVDALRSAIQRNASFLASACSAVSSP